MNDARDHIIGTQSILLAYEREDRARTLMDQAGDLWRSHLLRDAEDVFTASCPGAERIRLDRVELDLGVIAETEFVEVFPVRFKNALSEALARQIARLRAGDRETAGEISAAPAGAALSVLEHVLLHGSLPWWAHDADAFDPPHEIAEAVDRIPVEMAALAKKIGRHRHVRQRVVYWLADPEIAALIRAVAPGDASFILRYADDLQARQQEERLVSADAAVFRHAKWEIILGHLLADAGSRFNTLSFLRQTLAALAGRFRLTYEFFLGELARLALVGGLKWRENSLPQFLIEIYTEDILNRASARPHDDQTAALAQNFSADSATRIADALAFWHEELAANPRSRTPARRERLSFWERLSPDEARAVARALLARHGSERVNQRIAELFPLAARTAFLRTLVTPAEDERAALALDAWDDELDRTAPARRSADAREALAFWRHLPAGVVHDLIVTLIERHGRERLVGRLEEIFSPAERAGVSSFLVGENILEKTSAATRESQNETMGVAAMPALRELLETGRMPDHPWTRAWQDRAESWLYLALARHADALPPLLRAWHRERPLARKLARHFKDDALSAIVETVEPAHAETITGFVATTSRAQRARPIAAGVGAEAFRRGTWEIVLDYLLTDHGSVFNRLMFVERSIDALASRHNLEKYAVLEFLHAATEAEGVRPLLNDLTELRRRRSRPPSPLSEAAPDAPQALVFTSENIRRSPVVRLRLWMLILQDSPRIKEDHAIQNLLPFFWRLLLQAGPDEPWREPARESAWTPATINLILGADGEVILADLLFSAAPAEAAAWEQSLAWLTSAPAGTALFPGGRDGLRGRLWRTLIELWREAGGRPLRDMAGWLVRVLVRIARQENHTLENGRPHDEKTMLRHLSAALHRDGSAAGRALAAQLRAFTPLPSPPKPGAGRASKSPAPKIRPLENEKLVPPAPDEARTPERIAVTNAGLVLLAPFFAQLHRRCGLLEETVFHDFEAAQRAVHLLQFLVNGGHRTQEYSLVLNKILCGLDPWIAVVPRLELTEDEKTIATQLLESTAARWPRGAFISADGLRASYLNRPGRLERREKGWHLKVEPRGWDVLLPELDWTFPGPRPAWMPAPLDVDWI